MLAAAAQMTYLGPFTPLYRQKVIVQIANHLAANSIPHSSDPTLGLLFHDPLDEALWTKHHLPRDKTSLENAIMVLKATPLPIIIDPQGQANKYAQKEWRNSC
jgi:dynein heavy chain